MRDTMEIEPSSKDRLASGGRELVLTRPEQADLGNRSCSRLGRREKGVLAVERAAGIRQRSSRSRAPCRVY
jgi:hypothetical protein